MHLQYTASHVPRQDVEIEIAFEVEFEIEENDRGLVAVNVTPK